MLFAAKPKGFFVELSESSITIARTSAGDAGGLVIEDLQECELADQAAWEEIVRRYLPKKKNVGFVQAVCGVYPSRRLIRRIAIEPKRVKEAGYLNEVAAAQARVEPEKYSLVLLNANDGREYDIARAAEKDVLLCGLPSEDVLVVQEQLLARHVYPERLELTSLAVLGAVASLLRAAGIKSPILVLEPGMEATQSFIVSPDGVEASRTIAQGFGAMIPVVQKELGLKDEESAKKLFFSNTFDFTGMGTMLLKRLVRELQSAMGFHEVQTGQSIGHVMCVHLPPKLEWIEAALATQLGVSALKPDFGPWLESRGITISDTVGAPPWPERWLGLFSLMANYDALVPPKEK